MVTVNQHVDDYTFDIAVMITLQQLAQYVTNNNPNQ
jgi:hypothetical protein